MHMIGPAGGCAGAARAGPDRLRVGVVGLDGYFGVLGGSERHDHQCRTCIHGFAVGDCEGDRGAGGSDCFGDESGGAGVEADCEVTESNTSWRGVLDAAKTVGADLIVMGSHGRRGLEKLVIGSVAQRVVAHADVSVLVVRDREFVIVTRLYGASSMYRMWRHVLPNSMTPVVTFLPFRMSGAILALTSLDFLGLGVPPGTPSLGELLAQGKNNIDAWWISLSTFAVLVVTLLLLTFMGDALRDALDPRKADQ